MRKNSAHFLPWQRDHPLSNESSLFGCHTAVRRRRPWQPNKNSDTLTKMPGQQGKDDASTNRRKMVFYYYTERPFHHFKPGHLCDDARSTKRTFSARRHNQLFSFALRLNRLLYERPQIQPYLGLPVRYYRAYVEMERGVMKARAKSHYIYHTKKCEMITVVAAPHNN